jgi:hypothetical protein
MKRAREGPPTVSASRLNHPSRAFVASSDAQPAFPQYVMEGCNITACERPCVADILLHFGHLPARAALHFLMQA